MQPIYPGTLSEQLLYSTARIQCGDSRGTAFFFQASIHGKQMPLLVTNRHVVAPDERVTIAPEGTMLNVPLSICAHKSVVEGGKAKPAGAGHEVKTSSHLWFGHPDPDVDLAVLPVASVPQIDAELFFIGLTPAHVWANDRLVGLSALEEVAMCGAPKVSGITSTACRCFAVARRRRIRRLTVMPRGTPS